MYQYVVSWGEKNRIRFFKLTIIFCNNKHLSTTSVLRFKIQWYIEGLKSLANRSGRLVIRRQLQAAYLAQPEVPFTWQSAADSFTRTSKPLPGVGIILSGHGYERYLGSMVSFPYHSYCLEDTHTWGVLFTWIKNEKDRGVR
jgi:hypothetical protein